MANTDLNKLRNKVLREAAKLEGGKVEVAIGNLRSVWKALVNVNVASMGGANQNGEVDVLLGEDSYRVYTKNQESKKKK